MKLFYIDNSPSVQKFDAYFRILSKLVDDNEYDKYILWSSYYVEKNIDYIK